MKSIKLINLKDIQAYVISMKSAVDRRKHITEQLSRLGIKFEFVDGVRCKPGFLGCSQAHYNALSSIAHKPPFIIFEDDCSFTKDFKSEILIPEKADAVHLGVSSWGVFPQLCTGGVDNGTIAVRFNDDFLRVHNMLAMHAILYLSHDFVTATKSSILESIRKILPLDIGTALLQNEFFVLTPNRPFFYQDARYGGREQATRLPLKPVVTGKMEIKFTIKSEGGKSWYQRIN